MTKKTLAGMRKMASEGKSGKIKGAPDERCFFCWKNYTLWMERNHKKPYQKEYCINATCTPDCEGEYSTPFFELEEHGKNVTWRSVRDLYIGSVASRYCRASDARDDLEDYLDEQNRLFEKLVNKK